MKLDICWRSLTFNEYYRPLSRDYYAIVFTFDKTDNKAANSKQHTANNKQHMNKKTIKQMENHKIYGPLSV